MKIIRAIALSVLLFGAAILPVQAQQQSETFMRLPTDTVITGQEGMQKIVARATTGDREGLTCQVTAVATNNASEHPGSGILVTSGDDTITLNNVERAPLVSTASGKTMTLGDDMTVAVIIGADEEFSAGYEISLNCEAPEPACEFNEAISQSDPACFEPCQYDESIPADDEDCVAPKPSTEVNGSQTPDTPAPTAGAGKDLPNTGPTSTTLLALSLGAATYGISLYRQKRKQQTPDVN